ncbi:uncharacterized protein M421DRAFT_374442 [Didymella exigua CBS 183.55]|uniref:ATP-dependent DNA helicase n=1 Tax=Didymella exigua CBS 183.55 TaxID=1150837 RepID=A0A6A5RRN4_9PLEO|nr:uncharacterized protein M421DRAFT_374442 [Didymella exigua CBS 183.55]KAF1930442.1 hypothetical protein M421DRAFT_374442 [Didymella exigua CBS 183.55]
MPPKHIAQTSTEAKKAYKKNGPVISERTHKQLQRGHELEQRAAREREAETRRKLAKERREERERKETTIREQLGIGLATQRIGYSHTQANLKKGMEAFLGISKKKQDNERRRKEQKQEEEELAKKLEVNEQDVKKEPFDDDDDDDMDDAMLDLPIAAVQDGGGWVDDELDDDTLLEIHDLVMSDPVDQPVHKSIFVPPRRATVPPTSHKQSPPKSQHSRCNLPAQMAAPQSAKLGSVKEDSEFTRTHGPINKMVESALKKIPGEIIELLSHDAAASMSDWAPAYGLLHKLNAIGLPPHRLRIKVGCVMTCLWDLKSSSQLSKSQHVRVLRVENDRLECLTLDGQLTGTKTVITRVPFPAKYRNDEKFPFIRTQYPVRVAADYAPADFLRKVPQSGFKPPSINGQMRLPSLVKRPNPPSTKSRAQVSKNTDFKLPGLPAPKGQTLVRSEPLAPVQFNFPAACTLDGWDYFLESSTQIAREISADSTPKTITQPSTIIESVPPLSTQDLNFSLDDLDDEPQQPQRKPQQIFKPQSQPQPPTVQDTGMTKSAKSTVNLPLLTVKAAVPNRTLKPPPSVPRGPLSRTANIRRVCVKSQSMQPPALFPQKSVQPRSKRPMAPPPKPLPPAKKACITPSAPIVPPSLSTTPLTTMNTATASRRFSDFGMSTQEASSFFDDDDESAFGSPPIAV